MSHNERDEGGLLLELTMVAVKILLAKGVKQAIAVRLGTEIAKEFYRQNAGLTIYVPKTTKLERYVSKAAEALKEFDGSNMMELAKKFGIGEDRIRKQIAKYKRLQTSGNEMPEPTILTKEILGILATKFTDVAEVIGLKPAQALYDRYSGAQLSLNLYTKTSLTTAIIETVGPQAAEKLKSHAFGLTRIPSQTAIKICIRKLEILKAHSQGTTSAEIAIKTKTSVRTVYEIIQKSRSQQQRVEKVRIKHEFNAMSKLQFKQERANLIFKDYLAGMHYDDLAKKYGLTKPQVKEVVKRSKKKQRRNAKTQ